MDLAHGMVLRPRTRRTPLSAAAIPKPTLLVLSDDELRGVLRLLSMVDRVVAGMCCQRLHLLSSEPAYWTRLAFPPDVAARVTDSMLDALIRRVNAGSVTSVISLRGCTALTGQMLGALHGSTRLREIDLRLGNDHHMTSGPISGLSSAAVSALVESMLQQPTSRLQVVSLRRQRARTSGWDEGDWDEPWRSINSMLRDSLAERKRREHACCGHCKELLAGRAMEWLMRRPACYVCDMLTCEEGSSCPLLHDCTYCGYAQCLDCDPCGGLCDECGAMFCSDCRTTTPCDLCKERFCEGCRFAFFCDGCDLPFCEECRRVIFCHSCENPYCEECRDMDFCEGCEEFFCDECSEVARCDRCDKAFCTDCRDVSYYECCDKELCEVCGSDHD